MTQPKLVIPAVEELDEPPFAESLVTDVLRAFGKAARVQQMYLTNNPMHVRAMDSIHAAFTALWRETTSLELQVTERDMRWCGRPVLEEPDRTSDSLPWMFYKDGIRELTIQAGFEESELAVLLQLVQRARLATADDDDLLTLLWECEFFHLQYRYVDLTAEVGAPLPQQSHEPVLRIESPQAVESAPEVLASSGIARMDEYDSTLYFLEDSEINYLQREIRNDFRSDLRIPVVASLLDTYEQESDPTVREEIAGILDQIFLLTLSLAQYRNAAYLMREAVITANRVPGIVDAQRDRLLSLADRLSEPEALAQLLTALEQTPLRPPQTDLHELFTQLRPNALETILGWIGRSGNAELRALLESAGSRIAASHSAELVRLIASEDDVVAFEAIRRAGSMKTAAAVPVLAGAIEHGPPAMRQAGVTALAEIGSPGAMQVLERALGDEDSDIRVGAVKVLASRGYRAAVPQIESYLRGKELKEGSRAEKMAFFEAYGMLAGDGGVPLLDGILNARGFLGKRETPELRACAAMALGKIGTDLAIEALRRAGSDGDIVVRTAVSRAVRGG